jgi:predicted esterase
MGHGDADQVVAHKWGKKTAEELEKYGYKVDFRTYKYVFEYMSEDISNSYQGPRPQCRSRRD